MNKFDLLSEYLKRDIKKKLASRHASKQSSDISRTLFLQRLHDSDGKCLLDYVEIRRGVPPVRTREVSDHIKSKLNFTLSNVQLSYLFVYLEKLGAKKIKRSKYYLLKDIVLRR